VKRKTRIFGLISVLILLSSCAYAVIEPAISNTAFDWGFPFGSVDEVLTNEGFYVGYSDTRMNPLWVCYRVSAVQNPTSANRPSRFAVDYRTEARVSHDDYTNSGYDRGHMAPNAAIAYCYGTDAQIETFLMSNVCPQTPTLNRGIWAGLESTVRDWADAFEEVWVFTGPVFGSEIEVMPSGIPIPGEFYKIIVDELNGSPRIISFLIPQNVASGSQLESFLVSVDEVEQVTGLDFFWEMNSAAEAGLEAQVPNQLWAISSTIFSPPANVTTPPIETPPANCCDTYVASRNSEVFHYASCSYVPSISIENKVCYCTREEAITAGKRPCKRCSP